ncbi:MAG: SGNH/GDSL hydrolase family protein, partial [Candidatus Onthovivens sp.]|nr:SGNH/GDSL hydrolase family protein [Candidatus Onthovivens sp.]
INEGKIEDETVVNSSSFDQTSITGAIEYICARARELNNEIKIIFISCPIKSSWSYRTKYKKYVDNVMPSLVEKWGINFIDLLNYNPSCDLYLKVDTSSSSGYFYDDIHPNFIGYSALMYPLVNECLFNLFK